MPMICALVMSATNCWLWPASSTALVGLRLTTGLKAAPETMTLSTDDMVLTSDAVTSIG